MQHTPFLLACVFGFGCGAVMETPDPGADGGVDSMFSIGGSVTGFAGRDLVLVLEHAGGSEPLPVAADGSFTFPTELADGASYTVTIQSQPVCPTRRCSLANAAGVVAGADVSSIAVTCETPKQRLVAGNWGTPSIYITDDVGGLANNGMATPRVITGARTMIGKTDTDALAVDAERDLVYLASDATILVFAGASTITGDVAPARVIRVMNETRFVALELDAVNDRLYATASLGVYAFDLASTLHGYVVPAARLTPRTSYGEISAIAHDGAHDRLYLGTYAGELFVYDNARQLGNDASVTRMATWPTWQGPSTIAIDECTDRLYLGSNSTSPSGFNMFVFDDPVSVTGPVAIETASTAQLRTAQQQSISATFSTEGHLYYWPDSATVVYVETTPEALSGTSAVTPDKTVQGVVGRGYGLAVMPY